MDAHQELIDEYAYSWVELHKKSALLLVILSVLSDESLWSKDIEMRIKSLTGWELTERGLYRVLNRMYKQGLLSYTNERVPKTGMERKIYQLTPLGHGMYISLRRELAYMAKL